ncbi:HD-GYP domain-containing protein [Alginatibacterium sediminis]|uniref:HD-GYP domain-containing protein n=1 Tax=Alginatibacterium sediminis TaxID=2164068 RepID=UPI001F44CFF8|nr:two-component system response regulator [Alginatibacterium sediminis]
MTKRKQQENPLILIVDDVPENIDVLAGVLKNNYQIRVARNGRTGIKLARMQPVPDLILLDIMMPEIDGYEVCETLKADLETKHIPIIFVSAKIAVEDEIRGLELGAVDYITKPVSPPLVTQRVKVHLALSQQNRELDRKVNEQTKVIKQTRSQIIQRLGRAAEYKDNETGMHVIRMSRYSQLLAAAAGHCEEFCELLLNAAPMHDVGKIGIPDHILKKPAALDADEWLIMKEHTQIGAEILGDGSSSSLMKMARSVALTHHEKWDGSGYPNGLVGEGIPIEGRIVAIADVFDALTSERPYKKAWKVDDAVQEIEKSAGSHFDPKLVAVFVALVPQLLEVRDSFKD